MVAVSASVSSPMARISATPIASWSCAMPFQLSRRHGGSRIKRSLLWEIAGFGRKQSGFDAHILGRRRSIMRPRSRHIIWSAMKSPRPMQGLSFGYLVSSKPVPCFTATGKGSGRERKHIGGHQSQAGWAPRTGLSWVWVSRIESSGSTGSGAIRHKLAAALGSPVWALKGGDSVRWPPNMCPGISGIDHQSGHDGSTFRYWPVTPGREGRIVSHGHEYPL